VIVYCDTSFIVSYLRVDDVNYQPARAATGKYARDDFVVCDVHFLELPASIRAAVHRPLDPIPPHVGRGMINKFDRAVNGGLFLRRSLNIAESISMTRSLGEKYGWKRRYTTLDLWHLAAAWSLGADAFLTFDKRQATVARSLGLSA